MVHITREIKVVSKIIFENTFTPADMLQSAIFLLPAFPRIVRYVKALSCCSELFFHTYSGAVKAQCNSQIRGSGWMSAEKGVQGIHPCLVLSKSFSNVRQSQGYLLIDTSAFKTLMDTRTSVIWEHICSYQYAKIL